MRRPSVTLRSIFDAVLDIIDTITSLPRLEVKTVEVEAQASQEITAIVRSTFPALGLVQIDGTTDDIPATEKYSTYEIKVTYDYGASASGKQQYTYLIVGGNHG